MPTVYSQEFKQWALRLIEDHPQDARCAQWPAAQDGLLGRRRVP